METRFQPAQAALMAGDVEQLSELLAADPDLARARSQVSHPTLLQSLVLEMPPVSRLEESIGLLADRGAELTDPLIAASGINNVRAIEKLLELGAEIDGNERWSPLEEALYWGHEPAVSLLLERGANIRNLRIAAALGDLERMAVCFDRQGGLTELAGKVDWPFGSQIPDAVRHDPAQIIDNALVYAAAWGQLAAVNDLIDRGARVNFIPAGFDFAGTPLHHAALQGRAEMVDHLLELGADPDLADTKIGKLPEDWAEHDGHRELAEHLRQVRIQHS